MASRSKQEERQERLTSVDQVETIVDCDSHVGESVEEFIEYAPDRYEGVKRMIRKADEVEYFEGPGSAIYSVTPSLPPFMEAGPYKKSGVRQIERKLEDMADFGIDQSIISPTRNLALPTVNNSRAAVALMKGYNAWFADNFLGTDTEGINGAILIAPHKPSMAAEEIDRWADEEDMVAIQLPATALIPPPGHEWYDPIYEAAQDNDLPILMHGGAGGTHQLMGPIQKWNETYLEEHFLAHPVTQMWNVATMVTHGVPVRFPDLDFVLQECGIGWVPYTMWRLDDHYLEMPDQAPLLDRLPSEYMRESFYYSTQPLGHTAKNPEHIAMAIEMAGADNIVYASDLAHPDFDPPEELFARIRSYFDAETVRGIMGETAIELFDL